MKIFMNHAITHVELVKKWEIKMIINALLVQIIIE